MALFLLRSDCLIEIKSEVNQTGYLAFSYIKFNLTYIIFYYKIGNVKEVNKYVKANSGTSR